MKKWLVSVIISVLITGGIVGYFVVVEWGTRYAQAHMVQLIVGSIIAFVVLTFIARLLVQGISNTIEQKKAGTLQMPERKRKDESADTLCCVRCGSVNLQVMGNDGKPFSIGKAAAGAVLVGGVGVLAGLAGKKGKYEIHCSDCGHRFKTK